MFCYKPNSSFQRLRSRRLHLRFVPSGRLHVDRDLFLNLGRVQNLSVEVADGGRSSSAHNLSAHATDPRHLGNPVTTYAPSHPRAVFLRQLRIGGNRWGCDCDGIGYGYTKGVKSNMSCNLHDLF